MKAMNIVPDPELLAKYGCGPVRFSGDPGALYERHLLFDDIVAPAAAGTRERCERHEQHEVHDERSADYRHA
jgi:hypothetical protein